MRYFTSDNCSGAHPEILQALVRANNGSELSYGNDQLSFRAVSKFREYFGEGVQVFFVFNGTGANVTGLAALLKPFEAVICANTAHIQNDECGAIEAWTGSKLIPIKTPDGKLTPSLIHKALDGRGDQHRIQPKVISISQPTEYGTVYTGEELKALGHFARTQDLRLHMDGARISNAAVSCGMSFREMTRDIGVDVLSFGGTKNGLIYGEAVVIFQPELAAAFKYIRKQGMQLGSKMRFIAAQFEALLSDDLWMRNAQHSNRMAQILSQELQKFPAVQITQQVETNAVFARLPESVIEKIRQQFYLGDVHPETSEVRLMTSFDTTEEWIAEFISAVKAAL